MLGRAPLVLVAVAFTVGILLDRNWTPPLAGSLFAGLVFLTAFTITWSKPSPWLRLSYLWLAVLAFGAAYHHYVRGTWSANDVVHLAEEQPRPVQLRGVLDDDPTIRWYPQFNPLGPPRSEETPPTTTLAVLRVAACRRGVDWMPVSGQAQLIITGERRDLRAGDSVEVIGQLQLPGRPANPGERDAMAELRDRGIHTLVFVESNQDGVTRWQSAPIWSLAQIRSRLRSWSQRLLRACLPESEGGLAVALLLGDGSGLDQRNWDRYVRTGVVHVLVISGQHLVVLAAFLWPVVRPLVSRRRQALLIVLGFLWSYALLVGLRPSVLRAVVTCTVFAGAEFFRRVPLPANCLALAWLVVLILNPAEVSNLGCLLSFLCVAGLYWHEHRLEQAELTADPLQPLLEQSRPAWQRYLRIGLRPLAEAYLLGLLLWIAVLPLLAHQLHLLPLTGLLIGPPVVLLTSLAVIAGFLLLLVGVVLPPLVPVFAWFARWSLAGCQFLVERADRLGGPLYLPDVPRFWVVGFYGLLFVGLAFRVWKRRRFLLVAAAWLVLGLVLTLVRWPSQEMRLTFLAVGHGGCTVIETPDGRTLLYDVGSLRGPEVARYQIAPFLWSRGIRRVDEILLSHADLDHFNAVCELMERFSVKQITCTPSFLARGNEAVRYFVAAIERRGVPVRIVSRGDVLTAGDVTLTVLHPPKDGPAGPENVRSLVLHVQHGRHRVLLTGDLEGEGLTQLLEQPSRPAEVLMAPHHGSRRLDATGLMKWANPQLIISSQGPPRSRIPVPDPYLPVGTRFLTTWGHGAITVRSHASGLLVETYTSGERFVLRNPARTGR